MININKLQYNVYEIETFDDLKKLPGVDHYSVTKFLEDEDYLNKKITDLVYNDSDYSISCYETLLAIGRFLDNVDQDFIYDLNIEYCDRFKFYYIEVYIYKPFI
jgi:hypothetical protein